MGVNINTSHPRQSNYIRSSENAKSLGHMQLLNCNKLTANFSLFIRSTRGDCCYEFRLDRSVCNNAVTQTSILL